MSSPIKTAIVWFRRDLRLADHYALLRACRDYDAVVPVFILFEDDFSIRKGPQGHSWPYGGAQRWWLHHSLKALSKALEACGSRLILRQGNAVKELTALVHETGAQAVLWHKVYEHGIADIDANVTTKLQPMGVDILPHRGDLLREPEEVQTGAGGPFKVFTPFWRNLVSLGAPMAPKPSPKVIPAPQTWPQSLELNDLKLDPKARWAYSIAEEWTPGEVGAKTRLRAFNDVRASRYKDDRDIPSLAGVSRLSPHLHYGEISVRQVWHAFGDATPGGFDKRFEPFRRQLGWREFGRHCLWHFPAAPRSPMRPEFEAFPWRSGRDAQADLQAWQKGLTGYPLVDAGMRELWATGWMHNRVRMVVASFLVKNLRIHWLEGAEWFWDTLVDADLPNNTMGWQWAAGCGFDAAPYFRVFNPVLQSQKFDPEAVYLRRWLPELRHLPKKWIHTPWEAPAAELSRAKIELGVTYPIPIVAPSEGRTLALAAYEVMKKSNLARKDVSE